MKRPGSTRLKIRLDRSQSRLLIDGSQTRLDRYQYYCFRDVLGQRDDKQRVYWVSDFSEPQYLVVKTKALCCCVELLGKVHEVFFARFRSSDQKERWHASQLRVINSARFSLSIADLTGLLINLGLGSGFGLKLVFFLVLRKSGSCQSYSINWAATD